MPSFIYEKALYRRGFKLVAGVDEAGRGPLAGPIVAAAVILPKNCLIYGLDDSKRLSPQKRVKLYSEIKKKAVGVGIASVSHKVIDRINIQQADLRAMKRAVEKLNPLPDFILVDGSRNKINSSILQRGINSGDAKCASIAAASIVAKVTRDRLMQRLHKQFPLYGFARHKGYGTKEHIKKILAHGPCLIHRRSFYPVSCFAQTA